MNWYKKAQQQNISISLERYKVSLWKQLESLALWQDEQDIRIKNIVYEQNELIQLLNELNYPNPQEILGKINNLTESDVDNFYSWYLYLPYEQKDFESRNKVKRVNDILTFIVNKNKPEKEENYNIEEYRESYNELVLSTMKEMEVNKNFVQNKIKNINNWSSPVIIEAYELDKDNDMFEPETSCSIYIGGEDGPYITMFRTDNGFMIDDIFDAAEDDYMFLNNTVKRDYFSLVNEIHNKSNKVKILNLYTARPVKDREFYLNSKEIPSNIFLTNSYNRAEGIAMELSGSEKERDIWKIRIKSNYLINTYDGGSIQDYQVFSEGSVPVESMELIRPGRE